MIWNPQKGAYESTSGPVTGACKAAEPTKTPPPKQKVSGPEVATPLVVALATALVGQHADPAGRIFCYATHPLRAPAIRRASGRTSAK